MLTLEMLKQMPENTVFATGVLVDAEDGLFMTGSGRELRWVAVRGGVDDWCIYVLEAERTIEQIRDYGDKIIMESNIKKCVFCDDEAFKRYRY